MSNFVRVFLLGLDTENNSGKLVFLSKEAEYSDSGGYKPQMDILIEELKSNFNNSQNLNADFTFLRKTRICFYLYITDWDYEKDGFEFKPGIDNDSFSDLKRENGTGKFDTLSIRDDFLNVPAGGEKKYPFNLLVAAKTNLLGNSAPISVVIDPELKNDG